MSLDKSSCLNNIEPSPRTLASPGGHREDPMLLAEVTRRRREDGAFRDHELSTGANGLPNVFLTDEIKRLLVGLRRRHAD